MDGILRFSISQFAYLIDIMLASERSITIEYHNQIDGKHARACAKQKQRKNKKTGAIIDDLIELMRAIG